MYFVHPQIKISFKNLKRIFFSLFQRVEIEKIKELFPSKNIIFTDMGRNAFRLIIETFGLEKKEIIVPAFICDVFFPILQDYELKPIFVDVEKKTFNINPLEVKKRITQNTKAILVSHTFGLPADILKIKKEIDEGVLIIEDCAHSFLAKIDKKNCGTFGHASFFSLYKQFPIVRGGMVLLKQEIPPLAETKFNFRDLLSFLNYFSLFAFLFKKYGNKIAPKMIRKEKKTIPAGINKISLKLFFSFLKDYEEELKERKKNASMFYQKLKKFPLEFQEQKNNIFTFFSFLVPKFIHRDHFVKFLRKNGIFATRIWKDPIVLNPLVQKTFKIKEEDFPVTLDIAKRIVNLPLQAYYQKKDIEKIVRIIEKYFEEFKIKV